MQPSIGALGHCPDCDLSGADLTGANLSGAEMSGASILYGP